MITSVAILEKCKFTESGSKTGINSRREVEQFPKNALNII